MAPVVYSYMTLFNFIRFKNKFTFAPNCLSGVMVSVRASGADDRGFEHRSGRTNDYEIGICCLSDMHATLRGRWLAWNQYNVSKYCDISNCGSKRQFRASVWM